MIDWSTLTWARVEGNQTVYFSKEWNPGNYIRWMESNEGGQKGEKVERRMMDVTVLPEGKWTWSE